MKSEELVVRLYKFYEVNDLPLIKEAVDHIEALQKLVQESALEALSAYGQAQEAYEAQKAAEEDRDKAWKVALEATDIGM